VTGVAAWHLLATEYPPDPGGVADYTRLLAGELARRGESVHVWAPSRGRDDLAEPGVTIRRIPGFGPRGFREINEGLREGRGQARLFVQYVPTALGLRGMNVPMIRWLCSRAEELWVQFHEVALGWQLWRKPQLHLMHAVQLWMAASLARRANRIFVSIEGWRDRLGAAGNRAVWLPIPSNLPVTVDESAQRSARKEMGSGPWVAHFGTYAPAIVRDLVPTIRSIAREHPTARFLLLGRGAERMSEGLPRDRLHITGELPATGVAARLSVADVALQPFPDGISTRRTSAMAPLALGVPVVSTSGPFTDSVWHEGGVALAPAGASLELARVVGDLLQDPERRAALGRRGAELYRRRFSLERTCEVLQGR
jgi:glycosyltransferase involved in cell wall biosynthesis